MHYVSVYSSPEPSILLVLLSTPHFNLLLLCSVVLFLRGKPCWRVAFYLTTLTRFALCLSLLPSSYHFSFWIILLIYLSVFFCISPSSPTVCSPPLCPVSAVHWAHYVVVAAGRIELCAAGGRRHLLPDHRATLQSVQREVPEATWTLGHRQQTEGRQAQER